MGKKVRGAVQDGRCLVDIRETGGRVVAFFDCKGCARESDLSSEACWRGVAAAVAHASVLDAIVLSGHVETEYAGPGLDAMERMRRAASTARRFSARSAPSDSKSCASCELNPPRLFAACADGLASGIGAGDAALSRVERKLMAGMPSKACEGCFKASERDAAYLREEFGALCGSVMREAYGIVGASR